MSITLKINGRDYTVTPVHDTNSTLNDGIYYRIVGKRGAEYYTVRNQVNKSLMFIVPKNFMKGFNTLLNVWLTDESGELRVVRK